MKGTGWGGGTTKYLFGMMLFQETYLTNYVMFSREDICLNWTNNVENER